ncbi:uncharacterized protein CEXT_2701 [Caerostris extrusa]|uniref:Uncharacterized protein n=1 Tax=Caerostris extrusa TaxID=172846 RepID=A0AAV4NYH6_CAEEX|nr:uncharacterized protein CEXT_2701 [Caerostris extrusa]
MTLPLKDSKANKRHVNAEWDSNGDTLPRNFPDGLKMVKKKKKESDHTRNEIGGGTRRVGREGGERESRSLVAAAEDNSDSIRSKWAVKRLHLLKVGKSATKRENWPARPSCPRRTYFGSLPPSDIPGDDSVFTSGGRGEDIDLFQLPERNFRVWGELEWFRKLALFQI